MKAVVQEAYGAPDILRIRELETPVVSGNEVLIRVQAAGLHAGDWVAVRGVPYLMRPAFGLCKPKKTIVGSDVAGVIERVGERVERFQVGDEVFGICRGSCAEFAVASEDNLSKKPTTMTMEQAATIATSALTALQALRDQGEVQSSQAVLVIGASSGVGTFAVQIAKALGARVTGVCSTGNVDMVHSLGADSVLDYTREDLAQYVGQFDIILDIAGNRPLWLLRRVLAPKGTLVLIGGRGGPWLMGLGRTIRALFLSLLVSQNLRFFIAGANPEDLGVLRDLADSGRLTPVIDRTYPMAETAEALEYVETGHTHGKVVILVGSSAP